MRAILMAYEITDRKVWVADSFEGLPVPNFEVYPDESKMNLHKFSALAVSLSEVKDNFEKYGLLDDQVRFLKGWFKDTLPDIEIDQLALMRLDGDLYESTMDSLVNLYPKLSIGGYVIIDDYNAIESCNAAVDDFRRDRNILEKLILIPAFGAYWMKE